MKKLFKYLGALMLLVVLLASAFFVHVWYFKPYDINLFFGRTALQFALESPEMLSSVRVLEGFGIDGHNAELDDASMAAGDKTFESVLAAHKTLRSYADEDLSPADKMSKDVMLSLLDIVVEGERFRFHNYPVNQLFGVQNGFPSFMESTHQVDNVGDAEDYISRLSKVGIKFDQVLEGLKHRENLGILPPQFVVTKVLAEMNGFVTTPAEENILFVALAKKMKEADLPQSEQNEVAQQAKTTIEQTVYPAYQSLINYFEKLDNKVHENNGVWSLPDGDAFYALALKFFTTTDYTPAYIHDFGVAEVDRIQAEILDILADEGWDVSGGFTQSIENMSINSRFYYSDSSEGREQILDDYKTMLVDVERKMSSHFYDLPEAKLDVQRIPEFKEKTAPGAYYQSPAMDGSRPGVFYANLYDIKATPKYGMKTLAYHEGTPGHHYQLSIQQELQDMPFFRKMVPFTAYAEGWALYAERVAYEMGMLPDSYDNIGRLQAELFRGVRLVVDTGIHAKRWSREKAIDYMLANTGMAESDVVSEIERYFVLPGQATAYKVGMTKILELREKAQTALGAKYDVRDFHRAVLNNGSVPLNILEQLVDQYIKEKQA
ncbi:DUF885 domain-containing protein [Marinicella litoralis]|uniref:Uncharacterized protein (DUF885 family) n=1 Tax=Marinicella litoralis TaxID=644220 RepID=A0A4R6XV24_9GAMM|nr:DUF885 domain-containing protein [Marinicella litoralis]TDR23696.1 uncharacterized protein (DUF885 family) [Marinicella litoralis]